MDDTRLTRGVEFFNTGCFFECHDVLEDLWMDTRGSDRLFLQGLIQIAVGYYHFFNQNYRGSRSQFTKGLDKLEPYCPSHMGIELELFTRRVQPWLACAEQGANGTMPVYDGMAIPKLERSITFPTKENRTWQQ